jgi:serine/threonine-protein kinase RsbW
MSEERWIWQCDRTIPSDTTVGRQVLDELLEQLALQNWPPRDMFGVNLAVEEAIVNAVIHGNGRDASKHVRVRCRVSPTKVCVEITDEGKGFNPDKLPDPTSACRIGCPNGRGVMLMRAFMSRVQFLAPGNHVVLEKDRNCAA